MKKEFDLQDHKTKALNIADVRRSALDWFNRLTLEEHVFNLNKN